MSLSTDDSLPPDDTSFALEFIDDDDPSAADADEAMSGAPDGDADADDIEIAPEDDEEEDGPEEESSEDAEKLELRRQVAEMQERERRLQYEQQQRQNQEYWDQTQAKADTYFEWKANWIEAEKANYVDPDLFARQEYAKLRTEQKTWYEQFYASQNEARRQQYERAAVPGYAARVAQYFGLSEEQEKDLLDYPPERMKHEAEKMARANAKIAALEKRARQEQRKDGREKHFGKGKGGAPQTGGSGRAPTIRVKRGSMDHLRAIYAQAARG